MPCPVRVSSLCWNSLYEKKLLIGGARNQPSRVVGGNLPRQVVFGMVVPSEPEGPIQKKLFGFAPFCEVL